MTAINLRDYLQDTGLNRFHCGLLFWVCFVITFGMYALVIYGLALPALMREWALNPVQAGTIASYGLVGMLVGAIGFGILADRLGRRNILTLSVALFSIATALCALAPGPEIFSVLRLLGGIGIGGVLPTVLAMVTDYAPKSMTHTMVAIVMCFLAVGEILAVLVAGILLPTLGWQGLYWVAALPVLFLPVMVRYFLDAPVMVLEKGRPEALRSMLATVHRGRAVPPEVRFERPEQAQARRPVRALFSNHRAVGTLLIWVAFSMGVLMVTALSTGLPQLMVEAGEGPGSGVTVMLVLHGGTIIGTLALGRLADRWGIRRVLVPMFLVAAVSVALLGFGTNMALLLGLVAITGACTVGAQNLSYSFVSQYYPSFMRSTAIGVTSGIGQLGATAGPILGGLLLSWTLPVHLNLLFLALPGAMAALALMLVPQATNKTQPQDREPPEEPAAETSPGRAHGTTP